MKLVGLYGVVLLTAVFSAAGHADQKQDIARAEIQSGNLPNNLTVWSNAVSAVPQGPYWGAIGNANRRLQGEQQRLDGSFERTYQGAQNQIRQVTARINAETQRQINEYAQRMWANANAEIARQSQVINDNADNTIRGMIRNVNAAVDGWNAALAGPKGDGEGNLLKLKKKNDPTYKHFYDLAQDMKFAISRYEGAFQGYQN